VNLDTSMHKKLATILLLVLTSASDAAVTIVGGVPQTASDSATTGHTTFAAVSVEAGDYVVVSTASNKSFTTNQLSYSWTGTEGVAGVSSTVSVEQTYAAYLSYTSVMVGGTYDFSVLASNSTLTANSALYVLRPGTGEMILVADTATQAELTGSASALTYLFGNSLTSGLAIEAATTQSGGAFTLDSDYVTPNSSAALNGRLLSYSTLVTGSSWDSSHGYAVTPDDVASVGAVFTTVAVPEPSRLLFLGAGVVACVTRRRRQGYRPVSQ